MSFFKKLKNKLFKSSSKIDEGLEEIVHDGGEVDDAQDTGAVEVEAARVAEAEAAVAAEAARAAEQERLAEEAVAAEAERLRQAEEAAAAEAEQVRQAEEARQAEAERLRQAEAARLAQEKAAADAERQRAAEAEAARQAEEARQAELREAEARQAAAEAEAARQREAEAEAARARDEAAAQARAEAEAAELQKAADLEEQRAKAAAAEAEAEAARIAAAEAEAARVAAAEAEAARIKAAEEAAAAERAQAAEAEAARQKAAEEEQARLEAARAAEEAERQQAAEAEAARIAEEEERRRAEAARLAEEQAARLAEIEAEAQAEREAEEAEAVRQAQLAAREAVVAPMTTLGGDALEDDEEAAPEEKKGLLGRLFGRESKTVVRRTLDDDMLERLEELLIQADMGVDTALRVTANMAEGRFGKKLSVAEIKDLLAAEVTRIMEPVAKPMPLYPSKPQVVLVVGVNGSGKTTTIGKLASQFKAAGKSVVIAAGDTFRAAAVEQLQVWGERAGVPVLTAPEGSDPASLAFDAMAKAQEDGADLLMIDTAGRLQNRADLMEELAKIVRVIKKKDPDAPHNTLLVLDATTGQNALLQVDIFRKIAEVSGLVMTKLDGTAKGGVLVALADKFGLPIHAIGVGEQIDDLAPFDPQEFAEALVGVQN